MYARERHVRLMASFKTFVCSACIDAVPRVQHSLAQDHHLPVLGESLSLEQPRHGYLLIAHEAGQKRTENVVCMMMSCLIYRSIVRVHHSVLICKDRFHIYIASKTVLKFSDIDVHACLLFLARQYDSICLE